MKVLEVNNLKVEFVRKGLPPVKAVQGVSITIRQGETLGLVGESGCGKTTLTNAVLGLQSFTGDILFKGKELNWDRKDKTLRRKIQLVFQDPYASLNPRLTVSEMLEEPLKVHFSFSKEERRKRVWEMLSQVELPKSALGKYPHAFSGGQRQRIAIARALILKPEFLIADEPVSALDISVQAHILNLLQDLKKELGLTMLFISHDLGVVRHVADTTAVMFKGRIVEEGRTAEVLRNPGQEYTKRLIDAVPEVLF